MGDDRDDRSGGRRFLDLVAVVTGGTRGIGRAVVERLAEEGATVVAVARTAPAEPVAGDTDDRHGFVAGDAASDADRIVDEVVADLGRVDVLVNCAGATVGARHLGELSDEDWVAMETANLRSTFAMTRAVSPHMSARREGAIVCVSSIAGRGWHLASNPAYAAMKGGVVAFVHATATQLGGDGVRINAVCPGPTRTRPFLDMVGSLAAEEGISEEAAEKKFVARFGPALGRAVEPSHVAALVAFLASTEATTITGQAVNIDGGLLYS